MPVARRPNVAGIAVRGSRSTFALRPGLVSLDALCITRHKPQVRQVLGVHAGPLEDSVYNRILEYGTEEPPPRSVPRMHIPRP